MKYDVDEIKDMLTKDQVFAFVDEWGGDPKETSFGFICSTICHNPAHEGRHKLYYYANTKLFKCYTGCDEDSFDIFDLYVKTQHQKDITIVQFDAIKYIAERIGYIPNPETGFSASDMDLSIISEYERIQNLQYNSLEEVKLPIYDDIILQRLSYPLVRPWLDEGITREVMKEAKIGYYPGDEQITIPHYDIDNNFIGLRGRSLNEADAELRGKYRPVTINNLIYRHPLGFNLYNLNNSKENIRKTRKAVVFEGEKSALIYRSLLGKENDISVACCGFNISAYQVHLLTQVGADEIIIAFDRQFDNIGDKEYYSLLKKFKDLNLKYGKYVNMSFIFDRYKTLSYKASPIDEGLNKFINLYNKRIKGDNIR